MSLFIWCFIKHKTIFVLLFSVISQKISELSKNIHLNKSWKMNSKNRKSDFGVEFLYTIDTKNRSKTRSRVLWHFWVPWRTISRSKSLHISVFLFRVMRYITFYLSTRSWKNVFEYFVNRRTFDTPKKKIENSFISTENNKNNYKYNISRWRCWKSNPPAFSRLRQYWH